MASDSQDYKLKVLLKLLFLLLFNCVCILLLMFLGIVKVVKGIL